MGILAQVPAIDWGAIASNVLTEYGAVILLVVVVLVYMAITAFNINKRADKNEEFVLETAKDQRETKDELIKVKDEFHAFQVATATDKGTLLGRIDQLTQMYAAAQARYEEKERAWEKEQRNFEKRINELSAQYTELLKDHNGNKAALAEVGLERDLLKSQCADLERDKLELQTKLEHYQADIERLQAELATSSTHSKLDETIPFPDKLEISETVTKMTVETVVKTAPEIDEKSKEFSDKDKDE